MSTLFTPLQITEGRRTFHRFMGFNVFAFSILTGNVISVFALKLDVSNTYIGLLQSFLHLSMAFLLVGRLLMQRMSSVAVFTFGWLTRYLFASLLLLIPLVAAGPDGTAISGAIILVAVGGFHIFRGVGVAGQIPIVAGLASGGDRGRFLAVNSILANTIALAGGLAIAALLGPDAPLGYFVACFGVAIAFGFLSVIQIRKLPEPRVDTVASMASFFADVGSVARDVALRRFLRYLAGFALSTSALVAFLVVLSKRVFLLPDNFTVLLVAIGNMGAVVSGLINRRLVDASGSKPLIVGFQALGMLAALGVALSTGAVAGRHAIMVAAFFVAAGVQSGLFVSSQSYYYGLYPEQKHRNLGLLYSLVSGTAGAVGAYLGGLLLDLLALHVDLPSAFRLLFLAIALVALVALLMSLRLVPDRRPSRRRLGSMIPVRIRRLLVRLYRPAGSAGD